MRPKGSGGCRPVLGRESRLPPTGHFLELPLSGTRDIGDQDGVWSPGRRHVQQRPAGVARILPQEELVGSLGRFVRRHEPGTIRECVTDVVEADRGPDEPTRAVVDERVTAEVQDEEEVLRGPDPKLARRLTRISLLGGPDLADDPGARRIADADDENPGGTWLLYPSVRFPT